MIYAFHFPGWLPMFCTSSKMNLCSISLIKRRKNWKNGLPEQGFRLIERGRCGSGCSKDGRRDFEEMTDLPLELRGKAG